MWAVLRTYFRTFSASDTFHRVEKQFQFRQLRFRIMTPTATQPTTFEKHDGSDTRTIVRAKMLNVEYRSPYRHYTICCVRRISMSCQSLHKVVKRADQPEIRTGKLG
jgi:hypothetical protein